MEDLPPDPAPSGWDMATWYFRTVYIAFGLEAIDVAISVE